MIEFLGFLTFIPAYCFLLHKLDKIHSDVKLIQSDIYYMKLDELDKVILKESGLL